LRFAHITGGLGSKGTRGSPLPLRHQPLLHLPALQTNTHNIPSLGEHAMSILLLQ
jgi:hypothetical protein